MSEGDNNSYWNQQGQCTTKNSTWSLGKPFFPTTHQDEDIETFLGETQPDKATFASTNQPKEIMTTGNIPSGSTTGPNSASGNTVVSLSAPTINLHPSFEFVCDTVYKFSSGFVGERVLWCVACQDATTTFQEVVENYQSVKAIHSIIVMDSPVNYYPLDQLNLIYARIVRLIKYANLLCDVANARWHNPSQWDLANFATFRGDIVL